MLTTCPPGVGLQRPRIEIVHLLGREQREAPAPDHAARDVVGHVVVRAGNRAIADPDAHERRVALEHGVIEPQIVLRAQPRKVRYRRRWSRHRRKAHAVSPECAMYPVQAFSQRPAVRREIESGEVRRCRRIGLGSRGAPVYTCGGLWAAEPFQVGDWRCAADSRPRATSGQSRARPLQDRRLAGLEQFRRTGCDPAKRRRSRWVLRVISAMAI